MPKLVVALLLVCLVTLPAAAVGDGTGTFASYVDGSSDSVGGVNFTLSGLSSPSFEDLIQSLSVPG